MEKAAHPTAQKDQLEEPQELPRQALIEGEHATGRLGVERGRERGEIRTPLQSAAELLEMGVGVSLTLLEAAQVPQIKMCGQGLGQ